MRWTREGLRADLIKLFQEHAQPETLVTEASHLVADLGIDSLGVMELVADIEDRFAVKIPDELLREVNTVADVAAALETRLSGDGRLEG
jgi:acyl carrier protein